MWWMGHKYGSARRNFGRRTGGEGGLGGVGGWYIAQIYQIEIWVWPQLNPSLKSSPRKSFQPPIILCYMWQWQRKEDQDVWHFDSSIYWYCSNWSSSQSGIWGEVCSWQLIRKRSWFKAGVLLGESTHIRLIRAFLPNIQAFLPNGPHTYLILTS